jgi:hypothetical protein
MVIFLLFSLLLVSLSVTLEPGQYILFPSTFQPKQESKFWLTIYSEEALDCQPLSPNPETSVRGEWAEKTAGGSFNHSTWVENPKYVVGPIAQPTSAVVVTLLLRQPERKDLFYLGMYTGKYGTVGCFVGVDKH